MFKFIRNLFIFILIAALLCVSGLAYARYIEPHRLISTTLALSSSGKVSIREAGNVKIAFFSDTHFSESYTLEDFQKVIDRINEAKPDLILFGGDLIDNFSSYTGNVDALSAALDSLQAKKGKYAVFGNHDHGGGAVREYEKIMEDGGFRVLINESVLIEESNIQLSGVDDFVMGMGDVDFLSENSDTYFNLVLCHEPDIFDMLQHYNVDLMVAGHTHGGQIRIPAYTHDYMPPYGQKYLKGQYTFENESNSTLYVTNGIGTTKLPVRFLAPPELVLITVD